MSKADRPVKIPTRKAALKLVASHAAGNLSADSTEESTGLFESDYQALTPGRGEAPGVGDRRGHPAPVRGGGQVMKPLDLSHLRQHVRDLHPEMVMRRSNADLSAQHHREHHRYRAGHMHTGGDSPVIDFGFMIGLRPEDGPPARVPLTGSRTKRR